MTTTAPSRAEIAEVCDKAAAVIATNGLHKRHFYDSQQAAAGTALERCRVDIIGALNIAAHGTPRHAATPIVAAAERELLARVEHAALVDWNDAEGRDADDVIVLLKTTAADLQGD